jgi:hypothetical protein
MMINHLALLEIMMSVSDIKYQVGSITASIVSLLSL